MIVGALLFFLALSGVIANPIDRRGASASKNNNQQRARAIFFITNDESANSVVGITVNSNGKLGTVTKTKTGGKGLRGIDAAKNEPAAVDTLFSQSAIRAGSDGFLLAVNPGSDSLTAFKIDCNNPTKLKCLGSAKSMGTFPVSVAYSEKLKTACVLNGGAKDGVACFKVSNKGLKADGNKLRVLNIGQSTPAKGPLGTASQVFFNPDSTRLHVTIKGDPGVNKTAELVTFDVNKQGVVGTKATKVTPDGSVALFGVSFKGGDKNQLLVTDAAFGALTVDPRNGAVVSKTTVDGQAATCWAAFSEKAGTSLVTDVGKGRLVEVDLPTGSIVSTTAIGNLTGFIDLAIKDDSVFALAPADQSVAVVSFKKKGQVSTRQIADLSKQNLGTALQGMTVF